MSEPALLHKCLTKATTAAGDQLSYNVNWALSRRAFLKVYANRLQCGNWTIPFSEITKASLISFRQYFILTGHVLAVQTADRSYHFGLNGSKFWAGELPFPVHRAQTKLKYSAFILIARILLLGYLAYLLWAKTTGQ